MQPFRSKGSRVFTGLALALAINGVGAGTADAQEQGATVQPVLRIEGTADDLMRWGYLQPSSDREDTANDPAGLVTSENLLSLRELAAGLSRDDAWLSPEALRALDVRHVALGELFSKTPSLVNIQGKPYRIVLEKVGVSWEGFRPGNPFLLYLTHEVFDEYGPDIALGYRGGVETLLTAAELNAAPAIALTLKESDPVPADIRVRSIEEPVVIGPVRPAQDVARIGEPEMQIAYTESCSPQFAPTSCTWDGVPVCPSGSAPYFVLSSLMIKTDREGDLRGNPEIELFPLRLDSVSYYGGVDEAITDWQFDGRYVRDLAGQSRYLPNVQNNYVWYSISGGLAIFPSSLGKEWSATLVEQDDEPGRLKVKATQINATKIFKRVVNIVETVYDVREVQYFQLIYGVARLVLDIIKMFNDGDEIYQESLGISNELFCNDGLGQAFPRNFYLDSQEWALQGYFACVNPSCVPPPPPTEEPDCGWGPTVCP